LKAIERGRPEMNVGQKQNPDHYSLSSFFFQKSWSCHLLCRCHQICQNVHETDHQTYLYVWVWSAPDHWQINGRGTTPKRSTQAACSCRFDNLTVHHAYFEPTVGIIPNRIKRWNLFPCEDKITLFHPYK